MIRGIPSRHVGEIWPLVRPLIQKACDYSNGRYEADDFLKPLQQSEMQLWVNEQAAAITEIRIFPHKKVCCLIACGGEGLDEIAKDFRVIEDWAKSNGCESMKVTGRRGWVKIFPDYRVTQVTLERDF